MLLRHRPPRIDAKPTTPAKGFEHLDEKNLAVLRWLRANRVEFVLVGVVAEAVRGGSGAHGPVAVVPAPYGRNFERLSRALNAVHARLRIDATRAGEDTMPIKLTAEKLARGQRWTFRCGEYDVDIEGRPKPAPRYQELLYEAGRFQLADDLSVEVASPEDIEHYAHLRRTGTAPEIKIRRGETVPHDTAEA
jgi:hypothetical protein